MNQTNATTNTLINISFPEHIVSTATCWSQFQHAGFHSELLVSTVTFCLLSELSVFVFQTSSCVRRWLPASAAAAASWHSGGSGFVLQTRPEQPGLGHLRAKSSSAEADLWPAETDQSQSQCHHQLTQRPTHLPLFLTCCNLGLNV